MTSTTRNKKMSGTNKSEKMWSGDIQAEVDVFQKRVHIGEVINDPILYVEVHEGRLRAAGDALKFLQLAVPDRKSPFGWKPTALLMDLIRNGTENSRRLYTAQIFGELLSDYIYGYGKPGNTFFATELLLAVGLLREDADSEWWVTEELHDLFCGGYFDKRVQNGLAPLRFGSQLFPMNARDAEF